MNWWINWLVILLYKCFCLWNNFIQLDLLLVFSTKLILKYCISKHERLKVYVVLKDQKDMIEVHVKRATWFWFLLGIYPPQNVDLFHWLLKVFLVGRGMECQNWSPNQINPIEISSAASLFMSTTLILTRQFQKMGLRCSNLLQKYVSYVRG
jgi:hypothetical protein